MRMPFLKLAILALVILAARSASAQVTRGYVGTQVFQNCGNPDPDLPFCGVTAGAEVWINFLPEETGRLYLNTDGSTFDTVMAVFVRSNANPAVLHYVTCDNNSGTNGLTSALQVPVQGGQTNYILMAGVNGACGTLRFNYNLVTPSRLAPLARTPAGDFQGRVTASRTNARFTVLASSNLAAWTPLLTNNTGASTNFNFVDTNRPIPARRFYRALMLP